MASNFILPYHRYEQYGCIYCFRENLPRIFSQLKKARRVFIDFVAISLVRSASIHDNIKFQINERISDKKSNITCENCNKVICQTQRSVVYIECINSWHTLIYY
ncbi:MAG: hypothetical protein MHMPM18_004041 [Marteilia pararefringens]